MFIFCMLWRYWYYYLPPETGVSMSGQASLHTLKNYNSFMTAVPEDQDLGKYMRWQVKIMPS